MLIIILGFTYMLGHNLELVKKVCEYLNLRVRLILLINFFIDFNSLSETYPLFLQKFTFISKKCIFFAQN